MTDNQTAQDAQVRAESLYSVIAKFEDFAMPPNTIYSPEYHRNWLVARHEAKIAVILAFALEVRIDEAQECSSLIEYCEDGAFYKILDHIDQLTKGQIK